jgi:hypothetical protein
MLFFGQLRLRRAGLSKILAARFQFGSMSLLSSIILSPSASLALRCRLGCFNSNSLLPQLSPMTEGIVRDRSGLAHHRPSPASAIQQIVPMLRDSKQFSFDCLFGHCKFVIPIQSDIADLAPSNIRTSYSFRDANLQSRSRTRYLLG